MNEAVSVFIVNELAQQRKKKVSAFPKKHIWKKNLVTLAWGWIDYEANRTVQKKKINFTKTKLNALNFFFFFLKKHYINELYS